MIDLAIVPEIHASRLLEKTVIDNCGQRVGRVAELYVRLDEELPPLVALEVQGRGGRRRTIAWSSVQVLVREYLSLATSAEEAPGVPGAPLTPAAPKAGLPEGAKVGAPLPLLPVRRALFDKQIVDLHGLKVVRVNDVKFSEIAGQLRLVAVDVGLRGLLRRLGLRPLVIWLEDRLHRAIPDTLIKWQDVEHIDVEGMGQLRLGVPYARLAKLRPADLADIVEALNAQARSALLDALDEDVAAEILTEVEPDVRASILAHLERERASDLLESLPADEAADILSDLRQDRAEELLNAMEAEEAQEVRKILEYDENTAGRLMSTELLCFVDTQTAQETIEALRRLQPDPEAAYYLYVVDEGRKLSGIVSLRDLVIAAPEKPLGEIMNRNVIAVHKDDGKEKVGDLLAKYDLLALPVLDDEGRLVGVVSLPDAVDDLFTRPRRRWGGRG